MLITGALVLTVCLGAGRPAAEILDDLAGAPECSLRGGPAVLYEKDNLANARRRAELMHELVVTHRDHERVPELATRSVSR